MKYANWHIIKVSGIVLICVLVFGGIMHYDHKKVIKNDQETYLANERTVKYHHDRTKYTPAYFEKHYDKSEPNLYKALGNNKKNLNKGFKLAFDDCNDDRGFNKNQNQIKMLLGSSLGSSVLNKVKPKSSQASKKPKSISDHISGLNISYGDFDTGSESIPINIEIEYKTPEIDETAGAGAGDTHKMRSYTGKIIYQLNLDVQKNSMTVEHSEQQMK